MSTLSVIRQCTKCWRIPGNEPPPSSKPPTPIYCPTRVENTPTKEVAALTHPNQTPTKDVDTVVLEFFVHGIPNQTRPDHGSASSWIISHLGELSSVDLDSPS